jgi:hypothetical protein
MLQRLLISQSAKPREQVMRVSCCGTAPGALPSMAEGAFSPGSLGLLSVDTIRSRHLKPD